MSGSWQRMLGLGIALSLPAMQPAQAQSVEQFYKGRAVTMLVGTAPGGINDISARLVAKHLGRFIPGNPKIAAENREEGGGLALANRFANLSARTLSTPPPGACGAMIFTGRLG